MLLLILGFRANYVNKCKGLPRSLVIQDLTSLVGREEEAKLFPVRVLKAYLDRMKDFRGLENRRLFVSPRDPRKPFSKDAISYFLRQLIKEAHLNLKPEFLPVD